MTEATPLPLPAVRVVDPTPGTILRELAPNSPRHGRVHRQRRLALLAGVLLLTLAAAPFAGRSGGDARVTARASERAVVPASESEAVTVRELMARTTSTFLAATTSTTSSTSTSTTVPEERTVTATETVEATTSTTAAPTTTAAASPTTAAPTTTTTTTAPPPTTTTTTTTTAPPSSTDDGDGGEEAEEEYAYDDPRSTQVWYDLAGCEANGDWYADSGNGYYGGLQFSLGSWESVGGTGYPHEHPPETQIEMGRRLQAEQGWEAWPHCAEELGLT